MRMSSDTHLKPEPHHNRLFFFWAKWVVRWRWLTISLSLFSVLVSSFFLIPAELLPTPVAKTRLDILGRPGLIVNTSVESFSDPNATPVKVLERYRDLFGRDDYFMVMIEGDVFSTPYLSKLKALHEELEKFNIHIHSLGERRSDRERRRIGISTTETSTTETSTTGASTSLERRHTSASKSPKSSAHLDDLDHLDGFDDFDDFDDLKTGTTPQNLQWGEDEGTIIEEVLSLINARRTRGAHGSMVIDRWCDPIPQPQDLPTLKERALKDPTLVGQILGKRGQHSLILLRAHFMSEDDSIRVNQEITKIAMRYHDSSNFRVRLAGMPQLNSTLKTTLLDTLKVLLMISMLLMMGMLFYQFRHYLGVVPPLIVVVIAGLNTFAIMSIIGMPVTILSNILPAFIICVGIGDSVHLLSVYRDQFKEHRSGKRAVIETVAMTGAPVLFTSLTTMVGLLSFRFASIPAIQEMGTAGAIGVGAACFHSLFFLPALLTFNKKSLLGLPSEDDVDHEVTSRQDWLDRFIGLISDSSAGVDIDGYSRPESVKERRRRYITLFVCAILTCVALIGASRLRVWHNPLSWLPSDEPTAETFAIVDKEVGGTANIQLLIKGGEQGMRDLELLKGVEALKSHIMSYQHPEHGDIIGNVININDIVKETRRALYNGDDSEYRLPETRQELSQLLFLFENTGPDQLRRLATNDLGSSQMTLRLKWLEATSYRGLTAHIQEGIKRHIPSHAEVEPTGAVYTLVSTVGNLLFDLVRSFGTALLVITLIMILMLKGLKLGLLSMVPNLIPIVWLMGFMGFCSITIDMNNILIASIAIGLAVDDTIHLLHHFRVHHDESHDPFLAIHSSLKHAGRAMVVTSSILTLGFFAYLASPMKNIQVFGLLIGLCAALAMLIDLIFGPALLRTFYNRPAKLYRRD